MIKKLYKKLVSEKNRIKLRVILQKAIAPFYYGKKFTCNCCGKSFRNFLPKGNVRRENAKCPYCGSLERTRLLKFYLENETRVLERPLKVLHFAPEDCLVKFLKQVNGEYIDGDINSAYASNAIDITAIPYPKEYFDLIICSHVLGHVPDEEKAITEMKRVLKRKGEALVMTLIDFKKPSTYEDKNITAYEQRLQYYGEEDLCRLHGLDFSERLKNGGFDVQQIDYRQEFSADILLRYSLGNGERELIFKCSY